MPEPARSDGIEGVETDNSFYTALHLTLCVLTLKNMAVLAIRAMLETFNVGRVTGETSHVVSFYYTIHQPLFWGVMWQN